MFIHELGHFLCARLCKVTINEFSIGMGPTIIKWKSKKYDTQYSLRLLLIGGYVSMAGEDEESDDENAFSKKNVWQRILITIAGAAMNLILGILVMLLVVSITNPLLSNTIAYPNDNEESIYLSQESGLQSGDKIIKIGNTDIHIGDELAYEVLNQGYQPVEVTLIRDGQTLVFANVSFGIKKGEDIKEGLDFKVYGIYSPDFGDIIAHTFYRSISTIKMTWDSLLGLFTGRYGLNELSGPIGVTGAIVDIANQNNGISVTQLLSILVMISINLGIFNLLPIPALDGGRLLFLIVEAIIGRPINRKAEAYIHSVGFMILFGLMIFIAFKDVINLF